MMRTPALKCIFGLGFGAAILASAPAFAATGDIYTQALQKRLAFIFKDDKLDRTQMGVEVFSLSRQETLFQLNSNLPLSPASAIKLLTATVALKKLGADFTFKTEVWTDGTIQNGVLRGNLYLKGGGDPSLVTERLMLLVNDVVRADFKTVTGNLIVDDWTFDQVKIDPRRINSNTDRAYNAPIGGLSFNYNTTTVYFRPGSKQGERARVFAEPDTGYVKIVNKAVTGPRNGKYSLVASRVKGSTGDSVLVTGSIPLGMIEQHSYFNIASPQLYAGEAFRSFLLGRGVRIQGGIVHQQVPTKATKISELESLPLREIVVLMDKFSNNFIAESLTKAIGREVKGAPGTTDKGLAVLTEEATKMGLTAPTFRIVSGSGLTRDNRTTAGQFVKLLNASYLDFDILPELLSSLPVAGKDGTLRRRMQGTAAYGKLRAKTGTIDGVSSLVGMVQSRGGELLAFAVVMNDAKKESASFRPWQNYFAQALAEFDRRNPLEEKPQPLPAVIEPPANPEETTTIEEDPRDP